MLANILEQLGIGYLILEKDGKIAPDMGASIDIFSWTQVRREDEMNWNESIYELKLPIYRQ